MKKSARSAKPEPSVRTGGPTCSVEVTGRFRKRVRALPAAERRAVVDAIDALQAGFGQPHRHLGIGIRRLDDAVFECRAGLRLRLLFQAGEGVLTLFFVGSHDEIRRFIREM